MAFFQNTHMSADSITGTIVIITGAVCIGVCSLISGYSRKNEYDNVYEVIFWIAMIIGIVILIIGLGVGEVLDRDWCLALALGLSFLILVRIARIAYLAYV